MHSFFFSLQHCVKAIKLIVPTVDVHRTGYPHDTCALEGQQRECHNVLEN